MDVFRFIATILYYAGTITIATAVWQYTDLIFKSKKLIPWPDVRTWAGLGIGTVLIAPLVSVFKRAEPTVPTVLLGILFGFLVQCAFLAFEFRKKRRKERNQAEASQPGSQKGGQHR